MGVKGRKILLVEDHDDTRVVTALLLKRHGYDVVTAATKAEALQLCSSEHFDLLIGDIGLPDGSGLDLMREVAAKCHIIGIAYTGYGSAADIASAREAGFYACLLKPVDLNQFLQTIEKALEQAAA